MALSLAFGFVAAIPSVAQQGQAGPRVILRQIRQTSLHPLFRVEICNSGDQSLLLKLGTIYRGQDALSAIHLLLTEADGKTIDLEPFQGGIVSGRIDPLIVPIPVGATFVLRVDLTDYMSIGEHVWQLELAPGRYKLTARYVGTPVSRREANLDMPGLALMHYWTGSVDSNTLPFSVAHAMTKQPRH